MPTVKEIQTALKAKGFEPGVLDGILGPKTKSAIIEFKKSIGYKARSYIGPLTLAALFDNRVDKHSTVPYHRPAWLRMALSYLGLKEYKGPSHNKKILEWFKSIDTEFNKDEVPWCAAFVGGVLEEVRIKSSNSAMARSYLGWGDCLGGPAVGAVVVFWRESPISNSGHVGFVIGRDKRGHLLVLGGNQGDEVSIKAFDRNRVLGYRWPIMQDLPNLIGFLNLPLLEEHAISRVES
jgi:uncharacterized protein (TIGR02594 family)